MENYIIALMLFTINIKEEAIPSLVQRHVDGRNAVLQVYVEASTYDARGPTLLYRTRFAVAPEQLRVVDIVTPNLTQRESHPTLNSELRDFYANGKFCFSLRFGNTNTAPSVLPPDQYQQSRRHLFTGARTVFHPKVISPQKTVIEIRSMRKVSLLSFELEGQNSFYLEELVAKCNETNRLDDYTLEFNIHSPTGNIRRERVVVKLDPQNSYAICDIRSWTWDSRGNLHVETHQFVDGFVKVNGASWPKKTVTIWKHSNNTRKMYTEFNNIIINQPLPQKAFDFRIPENAILVHYDPDTLQTTEVLVYGKNNQIVQTFTPEQYRQHLLQKYGNTQGWTRSSIAWPLLATLGLIAVGTGLALWWRRVAQAGKGT